MNPADLTFLHANYLPRCRAVVDKHFDGYFSFQLITRGAITLSYDERRQVLERPTFFPCYPGPHIRFKRAAGCGWWTHRYCAFRGPLVAAWRSAGLWPEGPRGAGDPVRAAAVFDEMLGHIGRNTRWSTLRAINLLESLLLRLAEESVRSETPDELAELLKRMAEDPVRAVDCEEVAEEMGVSVPTLRRRFRGAAGVAIHTYALDCKIAMARRLLTTTDLPIKQIAGRLGYADVFYFSRQFRRHTGVAPGGFRRSRQGG